MPSPLGYEITNLPMTQDQTAANIMSWLKVIDSARDQNRDVKNQPLEASKRRAGIKGADLNSIIFDQQQKAAAATPDFFTNQAKLQDQQVVGDLTRLPLSEQVKTATLEGEIPRLDLQNKQTQFDLTNLPLQQGIKIAQLGGAKRQAMNEAAIPFTREALEQADDTTVTDFLKANSSGGSRTPIDWSQVPLDQKHQMAGDVAQSRQVGQAVRAAEMAGNVEAKTTDITRLSQANQIRQGLVASGVQVPARQLTETLDQYETRVANAVKQASIQKALITQSASPTNIEIVEVTNPDGSKKKVRINKANGQQLGDVGPTSVPGANVSTLEEASVKDFAKNLQERRDAASSLTDDLNSFEQMLKTGTGPIEGRIPGAISNSNATMQALQNSIAQHLRVAGTGSMSDRDVAFLLARAPNKNLNEEANQTIINQLRASANAMKDRDIQVSAMVQKGLPVLEAQSLYDQYVQENPLLTYDDAGGATLSKERPSFMTWAGDQSNEATPASGSRGKATGPTGKLTEAALRQHLIDGSLSAGDPFVGSDGRKLRVTQAMVDSVAAATP